MSWQNLRGRLEDVCPRLAEAGERFHAVLCDPPYDLGFMGKEWDKSADFRAWGEAIFPLLYPGALVLMFGGTRTWHRLACGMEDAGFEIWDTMMWLYGQGFPKAQDISKLIDKRGGESEFMDKRVELAQHIRAQRKAAGLSVSEVMAWFPYAEVVRNWERTDSGNRTPSLADYEVLIQRIGCDSAFRSFVRQENERLLLGTSSNGLAQSWSDKGDAGYKSEFEVTAAIHPLSAPWSGHKTTALKPAWEPILCFKKPLDVTYAECALQYGSGALNVDGGRIGTESTIRTSNAGTNGDGWGMGKSEHINGSPLGRYPANLILDEVSAEMLDEQSGTLTSGAKSLIQNGWGANGIYGGGTPHLKESAADSGGASRFFYTAKASTSERNKGLEGFEERVKDAEYRQPTGNAMVDRIHGCGKPAKNHHPTVKPIDLNRYLATLLLPPDSVKPRRLLVPFSGSGSEIIGAMQAGWDEVVGIEREKEYVEIANARVVGDAPLFNTPPTNEQLTFTEAE